MKGAPNLVLHTLKGIPEASGHVNFLFIRGPYIAYIVHPQGALYAKYPIERLSLALGLSYKRETTPHTWPTLERFSRVGQV